MPAASASWISAVAAASSDGPYTPENDMQPRPMAEQLMPLLPSARWGSDWATGTSWIVMNCGATIDRRLCGRKPGRGCGTLCYRHGRRLGNAMKKLILAAALASFASTAHAQYPTHPVTLIVPYPPGGPTDQVARQIAPRLAAKLGQSFIVEN